MRKHDGLYAGSGTDWAFREYEETWQDNRVNVRLPYDFMTKEERAALNGPVKTYHISELKK